jgi:hypothetical protein
MPLPGPTINSGMISKNVDGFEKLQGLRVSSEKSLKTDKW